MTKWWLPVKDLMNLALSLCPCMEMAASCRPAIQPSVRASRASMSSAERFRPITRLRNSAASEAAETQVSGAQLSQLAAGAQPGQGQVRVLTRRHHQVHLRRQVLEQEGESLVDRSGLHYVIVIQDDYEALREGGDLVEQAGQDRFA